MKSILRLTSILFIVLAMSNQPILAASHRDIIPIQSNTAPVYAAKQAKKIKKLEKRIERKERRKARWGNIALIVSITQVVLFVIAVLAATVFLWEFFALLWVWMLWGAMWIPSMIFSILAMVMADRNGDKEERKKALIAFFLGFVPLLYGVFKVFEFANGF